MINIHHLKYLFAAAGLILLYTSLSDKDWGLAVTAIFLTIGMWLFGYGVERLWLYINRSPGGTRLSKFLIGR